MHVRRLELVDFRSYARVEVDFDRGVNVLVGPNGVGKTNLVEALGYVATLASHRVAADAPLVRSGAASAVVRCTVAHEDRELLVELELVPGKANRARLGRSPVRRARDVLGALRLVLFAPEDLELIRGEPAGRRRYLDDLLVTRQPRYAGVRADYERVLKQRNALLRTAYLARKAGSGAPDLSTLDVWDAHLAQYGAQLLAGRIELVAALAPYLTDAYQAVAGRDSRDSRDSDSGDSDSDSGGPTLGYRSVLGGGAGEDATGSTAVAATGVPAGAGSVGAEAVGAGGAGAGGAGGAGARPDRAALEAALRQALRDARAAETERGVTLVGPHRDDLLLTLDGLPVKGYASHGECWSLAVGLRLAGYELLRAEGVEPVLVLDDVFAELDAGRRERLAHRIDGATQTLVTCAVPEDVPATLRGARFHVAGGEVKRVH